MEQFFSDQMAPFLAEKSLAILEAGLRILLIAIIASIAIRAVRFGLTKLQDILMRWKGAARAGTGRRPKNG
jgi:hypothetical protein